MEAEPSADALAAQLEQADLDQQPLRPWEALAPAEPPLMTVTNVEVLEPAQRADLPLRFAITFECAEELPEPLGWRAIFFHAADGGVGGADEELESVDVPPPVPAGLNQIVFEARPPAQLRAAELAAAEGGGGADGVGLVLLQAHYRQQKLIEVGYYVQHQLVGAAAGGAAGGAAAGGAAVALAAVARSFADTPRVTTFDIAWRGEVAFSDPAFWTQGEGGAEAEAVAEMEALYEVRAAAVVVVVVLLLPELLVLMVLLKMMLLLAAADLPRQERAYEEPGEPEPEELEAEQQAERAGASGGEGDLDEEAEEGEDDVEDEDWLVPAGTSERDIYGPDL